MITVCCFHPRRHPPQSAPISCCSCSVYIWSPSPIHPLPSTFTSTLAPGHVCSIMFKWQEQQEHHELSLLIGGSLIHKALKTWESTKCDVSHSKHCHCSASRWMCSRPVYRIAADSDSEESLLCSFLRQGQANQIKNIT